MSNIISSINGIPSESVLEISTKIVYLPSKLSFQFVDLSWDLQKPTNLLDWIGLFEADECNPLLYLDYKSFGVFGRQKGTINWKISSNSMPPLSKQAQLRFRYYSGLTGTVQASSPNLHVFTKAHVIITSIKCKNMKSSKNAYLVKVYYGNEMFHKTELSNNGVWANLDFKFPADLSQELLLVIKERLWNGNRKIGEANISIAEIVQNKNGELAFVLRTRNDVQFNTQVFIKCHFIPQNGDEEEEIKMDRRKLLTNNNNSDAVNGNLMIASTSTSAAYNSMNSSTYSNQSGQGSITKLPKGWDIRVDRHGRLIYIDHVNKRTTWNPPTVLEREYDPKQCSRRTVLTADPENNNNNENVNRLSKASQIALSFLQNSDFANMLYKNQEALKIYNESPYLKHIISRFRKNGSKFVEFENNRELVTFLNLFADTTQPLGANWEVARCKNSNNQRVFIDHQNKTITAIDPRLPIKHKKRTQSEPPVNYERPFLDVNSNLQWEIANRTEEISERIRRQMPGIAPRICQKLQTISALGESALQHYANDIDLVQAISAINYQEKESKSTSDFDVKVEYFYNALQRAGYGQSSEKIRLNLRRTNLLSDAFDKLLSADASNLRKYQLVVNFEGEEGLDYNGLQKEMFYLLSRELFNPYYALFEYSASNSYTIEISPMSKFVDHHLRWFELCGRIIGLALLHRCLIDTFFTQVFYKMLIGTSYTLEDLKTMDSQFYSSLKFIRENPVVDMDLTFSTTTEIAGEITETELLPGGKSLLVNDLNKEQFLTLMTRFRIEKNITEQMQALTRGLYSIIPRNYLCIFDDEKQLECLLSGTLEINIEDWRRYTEYKGYGPSDIVIKWFWNTVSYEMSNQDRLKLLQFVTGTQSIPSQGFKALRGSNGALKLFTIEKWGQIESLPRAHTCFNRIDLPSYTSQKVLKEKLLMAINESSTYGLE